MKRFILILIHTLIFLFLTNSLSAQSNNKSIKKQIKNIDEHDGFWGIWCNTNYIFALKDFDNHRIILKGKMIK